MVVRFARGGRCSGASGRRAPVVLFWAALLLILVSPGVPAGASQEGPSGSAGGVSTHLEVANVLPSPIQWSVSHEELSGVYVFNVSASDKNGVEDLVGLVLAFRDANGVETRHEAKGPQHHNRTTGLWSGVILAEQRPIATPVEVQIEVVDRAGGVSVETGQGEPLIAGPLKGPPRSGAGAPSETGPTGRIASSLDETFGAAVRPFQESAVQAHRTLLGMGIAPGPDLSWGAVGFVTGLALVLGSVVARRATRRRRASPGSRGGS